MEGGLLTMSPKRVGQRRQDPPRLPARRSLSFVMTLWLEPMDPPGQAEWRWRVVQVLTGEQRYFRSLADLLAYVSDEAGVPPPR